MITVIATSGSNRFIRFFSAGVFLIVGLLAAFAVDFVFMTGKPVIVTVAMIIALPIWLFSIAHSGYIFLKKEIFQVVNDRFKINDGETVEEILFEDLESLTLKENNNYIILAFTTRGQSRSYYLFHKWYLRDLNNQSFLKENLSRILPMVNIIELNNKLKIEPGLLTYADSGILS